MPVLQTVKKYFTGTPFFSGREKKAAAAYDLWSSTYDEQPGNLMMDLDEIIFSSLLDSLEIKDKVIADIGCGTGRHWPKILNKTPGQLHGYDVSEGMLSKLRQKFPEAHTRRICDNNLPHLPASFLDIILSTLTIAHIENIEEVIKAWSRVLKNNGDIIITDFHPAALAYGGERTFQYKNQRLAVKNYVHSIDQIEKLAAENGLAVISKEERRVDDAVKYYYEQQNALPVFEKFKNMPIIYGIHLKKADGIK